MKRFAPILTALLALSFVTGCVVRTTGRSHRHSHGHPDKHRHDHCHDRGGKHHKRMCHDHPHGPGHH
jgi:hypothetical protein